MWNRSQSEYLICYHPPRKIIDLFEFDVELLAQTQTSMHGSKEGHTGYIYRRTRSSNGSFRSEKRNHSRNSSTCDDDNDDDGVLCDPLYVDAWKLVKSGFGPLHRQVTSQIDEEMGAGPQNRTRSKKRRKLTRN